MQKGTILVVGGGRGIGLALVKSLVARGYEVLATTREPVPELLAMGVETFSGVDVTDDASVTSLYKGLAGRMLDGLVVNAGIFKKSTLDMPNLAEVTEQLEVNATSALRIVSALHGMLEDGAKLAFITSRMGSMADNTSGGYYGYRMSKAALNALGVSLALDLKPRNVAVALLHPGYVKTDMTGWQGELTADESAAMLADRIEGLTMAQTGTFLHCNGDTLPW